MLSLEESLLEYKYLPLFLLAFIILKITQIQDGDVLLLLDLIRLIVKILTEAKFHLVSTKLFCSVLEG
jgi:hypothetical protein